MTTARHPRLLPPSCRQGSMERWDSSTSRWQSGHLVLTQVRASAWLAGGQRRGCLHSRAARLAGTLLGVVCGPAIPRPSPCCLSHPLRSHLAPLQAGFIHFFPPDSAAAKAAAASGISSTPPPANGGAAGAAAEALATRGSSGGQLPGSGASSWAPPLESFALARCAFEQGEAPVFRIIESSGGGLGSLGGLFGVGRARTATLRAADVHDCMEWAIQVREAIAACCG